MKRRHAESVEEKSCDEPPCKKTKLNTNNSNSKPKKKAKRAKPYQLRAAGYSVGQFTLLNTARLEFKALFGMNKLTIAWSDVTHSQLQNAFSGNFGGIFGVFGGYDFSGMQKAANLMNNMKTERVEININNIDSIELTEGGDAIKMIIITNFPPIFTKQMNSGCGKGNKFSKSKDPTNGNAMKYKKHIIYLSKKPTINNLMIVENRLKNGSEKLKQLFENKIFEQYQQITMNDMFEQNIIDDAKNMNTNNKKVLKKGKSNRKKKKKTENKQNENINTNNKKKQKKIKRKRKNDYSDDSDEDWVP